MKIGMEQISVGAIKPYTDISTYTQNNLYTAKTDGYLFRRYDVTNKTVTIYLYSAESNNFVYFNETRVPGETDAKPFVYIKSGTRIGSNFSEVGATGVVRFIPLT